MEFNKSYKDLDARIESMELVNSIYELTKSFPKEEMYCITNQMRRAAISIPSNIAEGIGRNTKNDTIQFLYIARGSLYELETQVNISLKQEYINPNASSTLNEKIEKCKKILNGLIKHYKNRA